MGFFSKKSSSNTTANTSTQGIDSGGGAVVALMGTGNTITDGGAIKGGLDLAGLSIEKSAGLTLGLVSAQAENSRAAMDSALQSSAAGYQFAMSAGRSDVATMQQTIKTVLYLGAIVAAAVVLKGWKK